MKRKLLIALGWLLLVSATGEHPNMIGYAAIYVVAVGVLGLIWFSMPSRVNAMQFFKEIICSQFVVSLAALTFICFVAGCFSSVATILFFAKVVM